MRYKKPMGKSDPIARLRREEDWNRIKMMRCKGMKTNDSTELQFIVEEVNPSMQTKLT